HLLKSCLRAGKYVRSSSFQPQFHNGNGNGNGGGHDHCDNHYNNYSNYSSSAGTPDVAPPAPLSSSGHSISQSPSLASTVRSSSHYSEASHHPPNDFVQSATLVPIRALSPSPHLRQDSYQSREEESTVRASNVNSVYRTLRGTADCDYGNSKDISVHSIKYDHNHNLDHNHDHNNIRDINYPMQQNHAEATAASHNRYNDNTATTSMAQTSTPSAPPSSDDAERKFMKISQMLVTTHQSNNHSSNYSSSTRESLHRILPNYSSRRNYWMSLRRNMSYLPMFPEPNEHASYGLIRYVDRVFGPLLNRECADEFGDFGFSGAGGSGTGNRRRGDRNGGARGWGGDEVRRTQNDGGDVSISRKMIPQGNYNHCTTYDDGNYANNSSSRRMPISRQTSLDSYHNCNSDNNNNNASYRGTFANDRGTLYADDHLPPFHCPGGPMFPPPSQLPNHYQNNTNNHLPPPIPVVNEIRGSRPFAENRRGLSVEIPPPSPHVRTTRPFHSETVPTTPAREKDESNGRSTPRAQHTNAATRGSFATSANASTPVIATTTATPVSATTNETTHSDSPPDETAVSYNNNADASGGSDNNAKDVPITPKTFEALPTPLHSNTSKTISQQTSSNADVQTSTPSIPDAPPTSMEQPRHYTFASIHSPPPTPLPFFKSPRHAPNKSLVGNSTDDSSFCNVSQKGLEKKNSISKGNQTDDDYSDDDDSDDDSKHDNTDDDNSLATAFFEYQTFSTTGMLPPIPSRESVLFYPPPKDSNRSSCCGGSGDGRGTPRQPRRKRPPTYLQMYIKCERSEPFYQPDSEMDIVTWYQNEKHQVTVDRTLVVRGTTTLFEFVRAVVRSFGLLTDSDAGGQNGENGVTSLGCYKDVCFLSDVKTTTSWETNGTHLTPLPIPGFYYKYVDRDAGKTPGKDKKTTTKKKKKKKKEGSSVLSNDPEGLRRTLLAQVLDRPIYPGSNEPDRDSPLGKRNDKGHRTRLALVYCTPKRDAYASSRTLRGVMPETIYHFQILLEGIVQEDDLPSSFQSQTAVRCVGASGGVQGGSIIDSDEEIDVLNRQFWGQREVIGLVSPTANPKWDLEQILGFLAIPLFDYTGQQTMKEFVIDRCIYHIASGNLSMEVAKRTKDTVEAMQGTTAWLAKQMEQWTSGLTQSANECCDEDENALCNAETDEFDEAVSKARGGKKSSTLLFL
ncbi:hypothetical protein ACHAXS_013723, partial [Conticribra weissflogii]